MNPQVLETAAAGRARPLRRRHDVEQPDQLHEGNALHQGGRCDWGRRPEAGVDAGVRASERTGPENRVDYGQQRTPQRRMKSPASAFSDFH